jgi:hypothetical protein
MEKKFKRSMRNLRDFMEKKGVHAKTVFYRY